MIGPFATGSFLPIAMGKSKQACYPVRQFNRRWRYCFRSGYDILLDLAHPCHLSLKKAFAERALNAEMDHQLDQEEQGNNSRNSYGCKTRMTDSRRMEIEVPRDRAGSFDPQLPASLFRF